MARLPRERQGRFFAMLLVAIASLWSVALRAEPPAAGTPAAAVAAPAAAGEIAPAADPASIEFFENKVRPLLSAKCYKCHAHDSEQVRGSLHLDTREGWITGGDSGPTIVPGNPDASLLIKVIRYDDDIQMPPDGKLADAEIATLVEWVKLGAPDPRTGKPKAGPAKRTVNLAEERKHWAYQPLAVVSPPELPDAAWCHTPIDRFIVARLNEQNLAPNPIADRRKLIRRAYLDLLGLLPEPDLVEAFVADPREDAYERLVDRLLASPHYGERWARHWLDLARFAESHGFEHDYDRPTAYHYRDFVIRALNDDLPYDTFVKWQLAGDEFEPDNAQALAATGYLAAGVHSTQITKNQVEKERYDELDDITSTIGTSLLGLTIGCARCHDHKFDAIPNVDYYRLLSTFTTAVRAEVDVNFDPAPYRKLKAIYDEEHAPLAEALARYEAQQLPGKLDAWLIARTAEKQPETPALWQTAQMVSIVSAGGATFSPLEDGSYLASGKNPDNDTLTIVVHTHQQALSGLRLEALAHDSLPKHGPGRAENGNFALSNIEITAAPLTGGDPTPVKIATARATFEQDKLPVAAAIDGDKKSGWAVDPQIGRDQAGAFEFAVPVGFSGGTVLSIKLSFETNKHHAIGRPRIALSTTALPLAPAGEGVPQNAAEVLTLVASAGSPPKPEIRQQQLRWFGPLDPGWQALDRAVRDHVARMPQPVLTKVLITSEGIPAVRLHTQGGDFLPETHFLERGDPNRKKDVATQSFLQALMNSPEGEHTWQEAPPAGGHTSYRRRALANWITDTRSGAGNLLARVIANRLWQHHLGRGLVRTPSDFGTQGERPTHPELLDYLAGQLIAHDWHLKDMHRAIMTSAVYMQGSQADEPRTRVDHDNKLLWRRPRFRLEAEALRDCMLSAGGILDPKMYGPGTLDENQKRRSIYFTVKRSKMVPMMSLFDAPDALQGIGARSTTTVAPQALLLLNNATVREAARTFALRAAGSANATASAGGGSANATGGGSTAAPVAGEVAWPAAIGRAYAIAFSRPPTPEELSDAVAFLDEQTRLYTTDGKADARQLALTDFCQVLMSLNEFVFVE